MGRSFHYLPGFDATHLETYFLNDMDVIAGIFTLSSTEIPGDLDAVQKAFESKDLYQVREAVHKIKPAFNMVGLLSLEKDVTRFYDLCLKATLIDQLKKDFEKLWPKLTNARHLIHEQARLLRQAS